MLSMLHQYAGQILKSILVVTIILIAIGLIGSINIVELYSLLPFILLSLSLHLIQYGLKGLKFYILVKTNILGKRADMGFLDAIKLRIGSEFFSLIGISYIGDEFFRLYILNKRYRLGLGEAMAIGYIEVLVELIVSIIIGVSGSIYLYYIGFRGPLLIIVFISVLILSSIHLLIIFRPRMVKGLVISILGRFRGLIGLDKYNKSINLVEELFSTFSISLFKYIKSLWLFIAIIALTTVSYILGGLTLLMIAHPMGVRLSVWESIIIIVISLILSTLPITISGSGVFEAIILIFGSSIAGIIPWILPIAYRISTYYLPLIFTSILLYAYIRDIPTPSSLSSSTPQS